MWRLGVVAASILAISETTSEFDATDYRGEGSCENALNIINIGGRGDSIVCQGRDDAIDYS